MAASAQLDSRLHLLSVQTRTPGSKQTCLRCKTHAVNRKGLKDKRAWKHFYSWIIQKEVLLLTCIRMCWTGCAYRHGCCKASGGAWPNFICSLIRTKNTFVRASALVPLVFWFSASVPAFCWSAGLATAQLSGRCRKLSLHMWNAACGSMKMHKAAYGH